MYFIILFQSKKRGKRRKEFNFFCYIINRRKKKKQKKRKKIKKAWQTQPVKLYYKYKEQKKEAKNMGKNKRYMKKVRERLANMHEYARTHTPEEFLDRYDGYNLIEVTCIYKKAYNRRLN